ncbi:hypothetical protein, conserved [Eimeria praecox]|uniref:Uncharacterized protein n=1 Tax=Eimeria praecox TaxID=51316 RepID=U6GKQ5_9EIME|nr:hypothetical protein, conserved [Eimeria praecox]
MDAAGEVQRLLQSVEAYEDVASAFDSMAAIRLPLCLVFDAAVDLALGLLKLGLADLALCVLRLKAPDVRDILKNVASNNVSACITAGDSTTPCPICSRQQKAAEAERSSSFSGSLDKNEGSRSGKLENLHLLQAAGGFVLLNACAAAAHWLQQREDRSGCEEADRRASVLERIDSLQLLLCAWKAAKGAAAPAALPLQLQRFLFPAVRLVSRLCESLGSSGYSSTAAQLLSRCLYTTDAFEPRFSAPYWIFWWQLATLLLSRRQWGEASRVCAAVSAAIAQALQQPLSAAKKREIEYKQLLFAALLIKCKLRAQTILPAVSAAIGQALQQQLSAAKKREIEYKQLLFAALLIKCKLRAQTILPADAFEELHTAVKAFTSSVWTDPEPATLAPSRAGRGAVPAAGAAARLNNSEGGASKCTSLEQQIRKLVAASHAGENNLVPAAAAAGAAPAAPSLFLEGWQPATYRRLLLSLGLVLLQPESNCTRGAQAWGLASSTAWDACSRSSNAPLEGNLHAGEGELSGTRSPASRRREDAKGSRKKKPATGAGTSGAADSSSSSNSGEALLLKLLEVAEPLFGDFITAATRLDVIFKTEARGGSSDPKAASAAGTGAAGGPHDSNAHLRKKAPRQSATAGQNAATAAGTAAAGGPGFSDEFLRETVRAAQRSAASLPLCMHVELLWRLSEVEELLLPGKLFKCWRALECRLIYMNFFQPPVTDLEVFELEGKLVGDGSMQQKPLQLQQQQLQKLEELLRQGWQVACCCDLQEVRGLEEVTVRSGVCTDEARLNNRTPLQQGATFEGRGAAAAAETEKDGDGGMQNEENNQTKQRQHVRLLLTRRWDWEADIRSSAAATAAAAATTAGTGAAATPAAALTNSEGPHAQTHGEDLLRNPGVHEACTAADVSSSVPLICGMQLITAKTFEDAAAKYKAEMRGTEPASLWETATAAATGAATAAAASAAIGTSAPEEARAAGNRGKLLPGEQVLQAVYDLVDDAEGPPLPLRMLLRQQQQQKLLQPVTNAQVIFHGVLAASEAAELNGAACSTAKELDADISAVKTPHGQRQVKGSEAGTVEPVTVHVLQLRLSGTAAAGEHEFLVYTKAAAGCAASVADSDSLQDDKSALREGGAPRGGPPCDESLSSGVGSSETLHWRLQGSPRSVLQSCLGIHLNVLCAPVESLPWPSPPLPHLNALFTQPKKKSPQDAVETSLGVWAETEGEVPLYVLIHKLCTWALLRQLEATLETRGEPPLPGPVYERPAARLPSGSSSSTFLRKPSSHVDVESVLSHASNIELRLSLALEVTALWSEAFNTEGLEELLKNTCAEYLCEVLLSLWHSHVLPLANVLLAAAAFGDKDRSLLDSTAPDSQFAIAASPPSRTAASVDLLLVQLKKTVQQVAGLMTKCRFNCMRPLAAAAVLLFHLKQRYPHLSTGEDCRLPELLRGLIVRAEVSACELAAPFVEAIAAEAAAPAAPPAAAAAAAAAASALLASADPAAYWEQQDQEETLENKEAQGKDNMQSVQSVNKASNGRQLEEELLQQQKLLMNAGACPTWDAEPAEAWTLLCRMYELEARLTVKPFHDSPAPFPHAVVPTASGGELNSSSSGAVAASNKVEVSAAASQQEQAPAGDGSTQQVLQTQRLKQQCGLNCYRRCLSLCALAELLPSSAASASTAAAEVEATLAAKLERRWAAAVAAAGATAATTAVAEAAAAEVKPSADPAARSGSSSNNSGAVRKRRQLGAPLMVGRGPQFLLLSLPAAAVAGVPSSSGAGRAWRVLYGGPLRTHGGLGVSRHQKAVAGSGLRFEPTALVRIQQLKDTETYVVAYEELGGGRSDLSDTSLPLSCSWPLPLAMLKARIYKAALRCAVPRTAEAVLSDLWSCVAADEAGVKGKIPKKPVFKENALRRLCDPISPQHACLFCRLPPAVLRSIAESVVRSQVYRQAANFEVAVYGRSTDVAEEQLALLLNTLFAIISSLSSFPLELLSPVLRPLAALTTTPVDALPPQIRAAEAALLGLACLAAAQFQIPLIHGLVNKQVPRCLALPAAAGTALSPVHKRVILSAWLSACIAATTSCPWQRGPTAATLSETLPPPPWLCDSRTAEGKQLNTLLLAVLLAAPAELAAALQRLADFGRNAFKTHGEKDDACMAHLLGAVLSVGLKRRIREASWTDIADAEEMVAEAQAALETAVPAATAALHSYADALAHVHAAAAEPLVEWLAADDLRRHRKAPLPKEPPPAVSSDAAAETATPTAMGAAAAAAGAAVGVSALDTAAQVQTLYQQEVALERRLRTAQTEMQTALQHTVELQLLSHFTTLLLAAPLEAISAHRRAAALPILPTDNSSSSNNSNNNNNKPPHSLHGLFDFDAIAADPLFQPSSDDSAATAAEAAGDSAGNEGTGCENTGHTNAEELSAASTSRGTALGETLEHKASAKVHPRGSAAAASAAAAAASPYSVSPDKHAELPAAGAATTARAGSAGGAAADYAGLWSAFLLLFQRTATAASCAVAANAPLLAYSVIMQLGNALFMMHLDARFAAAFLEDPSCSRCMDTASLAEAAAAALEAGGLAATREGIRGAEGAAAGAAAAASKQSKRGEMKGSGRPMGSVSANMGMPGARGYKGQQQPSAEAKTQLPLPVAAGVVAQACTDLLYIVLKQHLLAADKDELSASQFEAILKTTAPPEDDSREPASTMLQATEGAAEEDASDMPNSEAASRQALICQRAFARPLAPGGVSVPALQPPRKESPAAAMAKRRATKGPEFKGDSTSPPSLMAAAEEAAKAADEIRRFWEEREAAMVASLTKQQQLASQLEQELSRLQAAPNPADTLLISLDRARRTLWEAKCSNCDPSSLEQLLQKVLRQHQRAVHLLRREKHFEGLCGVLCRLGDLAWLGSQQELACSSWQEAVEACFWRRNMLQEWAFLDDGFFVPEAKQIDIRLRSFLPLYRWARLTHRRSFHQQLHAALLASRILCGVLETAADRPLSHADEPAVSQFYAGRSDGGVIRHRMKQLHAHLNFLPTSVLSPAAEGSSSSSSSAAELVESLIWFACVLRSCDFTREKAFPLLATAEFVAADVCRNVPMTIQCRLARTLLCIE